MRGVRPEIKPDMVRGSSHVKAAPPAHIPRAARKEWDRVTSDLRERGLLTESMLGIVASYVIATWQVAVCTKAIERSPWVKTKTGEPKPHPAFGLLTKAQEHVARLGAELGLTPAARSRKGMQPPERSNEDDDWTDLDL